jgi:hypothetical protein
VAVQHPAAWVGEASSESRGGTVKGREC